MSRKSILGIMVSLLFVCSPVLVKADLINGNFDDLGDFTGLRGYNLNSLTEGQWDVFDEIPGWRKGDGTSGIEIQYNTVVDAYSPNYYVELDSHGGDDTNSSMYQTVDLEQGLYELSFMYHARTNLAGDDNGIEAYIGNTFINSISRTTNEQLAVWELVTWTFTVSTAGTYDLSFGAWGTDNSLGGFIDNVALNAAPVPEPATMLLFGSGLIGLAGLRARRKK